MDRTAETQVSFLLTIGSKNCIMNIVVGYGVWLSLVERYVRDVEVAGSNPVTPIE